MELGWRASRIIGCWLPGGFAFASSYALLRHVNNVISQILEETITFQLVLKMMSAMDTAI